MAFADLLVTPCQILERTPGDPDAYGNPASTFKVLDTVVARKSSIRSRPHEYQAGKKFSEDYLTIFMLPWAKGTLTEHNWLRMEGELMNITEVLTFQDRFGTPHHTEAYVLVVKP